ncbi:M23 family metallopeptidase [Capnocytophaga canimorsus]|uniref:M23 family metallopeptidase n=1 Tax=Capnocytophaga canimorsus TaxID=28188 RepID=UPI001EDEF3FA|nr:M23 family metallopeptidase [Capnocytophaga canimorsus]GJQ05765.1 peptidase M23 [Capnocytophaga canimorsus]
MEKERETKRKYLKRKLLSKYRLVFMDEETFEEKGSIRLNRLNVFLVSSFFAISMIVLTTLLIIYTPLRQYILGFSEVKLRKEVVKLNFSVDSLESEIAKNNLYLTSVKKVLVGDIQPEKINKDSIFESFKIDPQSIDFKPNRQDSLLRQEVADEERYNVFEKASYRDKEVLLFAPLRGEISNEFSPENRHYGIDIIAAEGTPVKVVADGTVIFSDWTIETGYVIIVEHKDNLISVYKHNSSLAKRQGNQVRTGEVIATVGNTGELTTGPHLHFELWNNGYAINPLSHIDFK